jgi:hypothetical protein
MNTILRLFKYAVPLFLLLALFYLFVDLATNVMRDATSAYILACTFFVPIVFIFILAFYYIRRICPPNPQFSQPMDLRVISVVVILAAIGGAAYALGLFTDTSAPEFNLSKWMQGEPCQIRGNLKGKVVVVEFWTDGC